MIKYKSDIYKKIKIKAFENKKTMKQLVLEKYFAAGTLTKIKNGDTGITLKVVDDLCSFLNCDISDIIEYVQDASEDGNGSNTL